MFKLVIVVEVRPASAGWWTTRLCSARQPDAYALCHPGTDVPTRFVWE
jgi:hypothetical protein